MTHLAHELPLPRAALLGAAALALAAAIGLAGCAPAVIAVGVGAGAMVAADPRSAGAQVDDEAIELSLQANEAVQKENVHLNVTSYNGLVLLTGEVPTAAVRDEVERIAKAANRVRSVQNELFVGPISDYSARTNDGYITSLVKTRFLDEPKFAPNRVKVVTERGVVYLMGLVTRDEGAAAAQVAATTSGVTRVVKVFEYTN
ncbi:MAG: BON domain-containing protein [Betaproteobacteria bacterium]|jgi:osmotically-inducible protein OsmY|nr:BON domain-containing protein [Betaproteobacteria bacterium]MBK7082458.1 BON domain-containing protein [Betaproteobacteria bacterium]MBK7744275.1 BON domain-containing protein [Betaproteobacteria bacterium]MBK8689933.1 BON domain-containing protein [Betaproteobacteria bacterium]